MKTRFSTLDICAALSEIQQKAIGLRLVNVYDIDNKTYLFKLSKPDLKMVLLIESGVRIHLSEFDWPKNNIPSGFAMKMRKHLRGRRLVSASQLGSDRIIDLQFGSDEAAFHVFLELYDRGNIALTDHQDVILNLLRYRKNVVTKPGEAEHEENDDVRFVVHEPYPRHSARPVEPLLSVEKLKEIFNDAKEDAIIKRVLMPHLPYGAACIDHCLSIAGFSGNTKLGKGFLLERGIETLHSALADAENFLGKAKTGECEGYILQKREKKTDGVFLANIEFHPFLFKQHEDLPHKKLPSFNQAVDEFFSSLESQKNDMKVLQREKAAYKKLDNVRRDHESRLQSLRNEQDEDKRKALIIENNLELVDQAIRVICSAIANQVNWNEIKTLVSDAQARGDRVASAIKSLKLDTNSMVMSLSEVVFDNEDSDFSDSSDEDLNARKQAVAKPVKVDIDLSMTAYANAQNYYNKKRQAAQKEQRTLDASTKAFKSAEKKTKQTLKEAAVISNIQKARKTFWFEKFLWFISSENYLVLGGRDAQQNEILVKKYLRPGDAYVHADLHGATSCVIKNPAGLPVPPKTLNEAGTMAICHSAAWDAKVITSAWWVRHDQVSKTAPSGEYLTTGSFMVRGKKNYLPPSYLIYGFGFLFKVDETCVWKHKGERKVRAMDDELSSIANTTEQMEEIELASYHESELHEEECSSALQNPDEPAPTDDPLTETNLTSESSANNEKLDPNSENLGSTSDKNLEGQFEENEIKPEIGAENEDSSSENEGSIEPPLLQYPDTHLKINYSAPDKYQLDTLQNIQDDDFDDHVYLGDDEPVSLRTEKLTEQRKEKPRMSAKQKRELKKQQRKQPNPTEEKQETTENIEENEDSHKKKEPNPHQPYVRGQKKKLRRKNKDQSDDEDERRRMMQMLQSAKHKEKKKTKKQEKIKQSQAKENANKKSQKNTKAPRQAGGAHEKRRETEDKQYDSEEERELALKEENLQLTEVTNALDSLTGIPTMDDILLFAIPVCAPYNTMQNYKFKVKLTPGTGKKGKAAKTAISMFQAFRETTAQERDHLRSVKDHDLSRNMPGKVKLSAPNLQKLKGRKK